MSVITSHKRFKKKTPSEWLKVGPLANRWNTWIPPPRSAKKRDLDSDKDSNLNKGRASQKVVTIDSSLTKNLAFDDNQTDKKIGEHKSSNTKSNLKTSESHTVASQVVSTEHSQTLSGSKDLKKMDMDILQRDSYRGADETEEEMHISDADGEAALKDGKFDSGYRLASKSKITSNDENCTTEVSAAATYSRGSERDVKLTQSESFQELKAEGGQSFNDLHSESEKDFENVKSEENVGDMDGIKDDEDVLTFELQIIEDGDLLCEDMSIGMEEHNFVAPGLLSSCSDTISNTITETNGMGTPVTRLKVTSVNEECLALDGDSKIKETGVDAVPLIQADDHLIQAEVEEKEKQSVNENTTNFEKKLPPDINECPEISVKPTLDGEKIDEVFLSEGSLTSLPSDAKAESMEGPEINVVAVVNSLSVSNVRDTFGVEDVHREEIRTDSLECDKGNCAKVSMCTNDVESSDSMTEVQSISNEANRSSGVSYGPVPEIIITSDQSVSTREVDEDLPDVVKLKDSEKLLGEKETEDPSDGFGKGGLEMESCSIVDCDKEDKGVIKISGNEVKGERLVPEVDAMFRSNSSEVRNDVNIEDKIEVTQENGSHLRNEATMMLEQDSKLSSSDVTDGDDISEVKPINSEDSDIKGKMTAERYILITEDGDSFQDDRMSTEAVQDPSSGEDSERLKLEIIRESIPMSEEEFIQDDKMNARACQDGTTGDSFEEQKQERAERYILISDEKDEVQEDYKTSSKISEDGAADWDEDGDTVFVDKDVVHISISNNRGDILHSSSSSSSSSSNSSSSDIHLSVKSENLLHDTDEVSDEEAVAEITDPNDNDGSNRTDLRESEDILQESPDTMFSNLCSTEDENGWTECNSDRFESAFPDIAVKKDLLAVAMETQAQQVVGSEDDDDDDIVESLINGRLDEVESGHTRYSDTSIKMEDSKLDTGELQAEEFESSIGEDSESIVSDGELDGIIQETGFPKLQCIDSTTDSQVNHSGREFSLEQNTQDFSPSEPEGLDEEDVGVTRMKEKWFTFPPIQEEFITPLPKKSSFHPKKLELTAKNLVTDSIPKFLTPLKDFSCCEGEEALFYIEFIRTENVSVEWYQDGALLQDCKDYLITVNKDSSTLLIMDTIEEDSGQIDVIIKNKFGEASSRAELSVSLEGRKFK